MRCAWVVLGAASLWMAACTTTPVRAPVGDLQTLEHWQASGRIAIAGAEGGGSGSFHWNQVRANSDIQIRGPVGVGSLRVQLDTAHPESMRLELGNGRQLEADAAWAELERQLGAAVPAANLRYWLLGLAAPGEHEWLQRSEQQAVLAQDGWRIEFLQYADVQGQRTPTRIKATHEPARIRLVIDRWTLGQ